MTEYEVKYKKPLWATLVSLIVVILIGLIVISSLREQNWFSVIIKALAKSMPFGNAVLKAVCMVIERINGVVPSIASGIQSGMTAGAFFRNLVKLLFTGVMLDLFKELCKLLLGADKSGNARDRILYFVSTFIAVILSTLAAGIILAAIDSFIGPGWSLAVEILICLGTLAAGILVALSKYASGGLIYIGLKYVLLNSLITLANCFIIMLVLGALQEGISLGVFAGSMSLALLILIMMVGLSLAVDSVFPSKRIEVRERR